MIEGGAQSTMLKNYYSRRRVWPTSTRSSFSLNKQHSRKTPTLVNNHNCSFHFLQHNKRLNVQDFLLRRLILMYLAFLDAIILLLLYYFISFTHIQCIYSQTSEQRTLWDLYKLKCFVLCREVVLFSEVQNVLEL